MMDLKYETLMEPVMQRAREKPLQTCIVFINEDGTQTIITAEKFHADASATARALLACGIGAGDLVILVLRHSQTLLSAFWGAMYLGAIASIFPFLTEKLDPLLYKQRVKTLVAQEGARAVITFPEFKDEMCELLKGVDCRVLSTHEVPLEQPGTHHFWAEPSGEKIAFLQHSSGTTGLQKGVALTHRAVLNQIRSYSRAIDLQPEDRVVSWLPLYHDMGLIAGFILPLVAGIPLVLMSPFQWVRSPKILLQAISQYRGTLCWLPNFAYNHSVRGIRERDLEGVDLSSLRAVINCSEPVRFDSHQMFYNRFKGYGLREEALAACYAMAENTFAVTQSPVGRSADVDWVRTSALQQEKRAVKAVEGEAGATPMVSCGFAVEGVEIKVVDPDRLRLGERAVGEIILRSDCMLSSYYHRPEATLQAIQDGWYFTGDMGYIADGQLYISGRKKDLIIVGGKNIFPQDLEAIANTLPGLYPGRAVAFGLMDDRLGSEAIGMVCELQDESAGEEVRSEIERSLRLLITQQTEVVLSEVLLVGHGWLIKTSSGKIARADNRGKYMRVRDIKSES